DCGARYSTRNFFMPSAYLDLRGRGTDSLHQRGEIGGHRLPDVRDRAAAQALLGELVGRAAERGESGRFGDRARDDLLGRNDLVDVARGERLVGRVDVRVERGAGERALRQAIAREL